MSCFQLSNLHLRCSHVMNGISDQETGVHQRCGSANDYPGLGVANDTEGDQEGYDLSRKGN